MAGNRALTYLTYLKLDTLLSAQQPLSADEDGQPEHDELLFIIIHQVFELWFKQLLHELDYAGTQIRASDLGSAAHVLKRVRAIVKVMVSQVDVLETMTPVQFSAFRDRLDQASGLQSYQFREVEFALGYKNRAVLERYPAGSDARERLQARLVAPTLWDAFLNYLASRGHALSDAVLERDVTLPVAASEEVCEVLVAVYQHDPETTGLAEALIDLDEGIQEWRYRHVKMVQRTIGMKPGTGGSDGVPYLLSTLDRPMFPDLWAVRSKL